MFTTVYSRFCPFQQKTMDSLKRKRTSEEEERAGKSPFQGDELSGSDNTMNSIEFQQEYKNVNCEKRLQVGAHWMDTKWQSLVAKTHSHVKTLQKVASWQLLDKNQMANIALRVGSHFPSFSIGCFDKDNNRMPFQFRFNSMNLRMVMRLTSCKGIVVPPSNPLVLSADKLTMTLKDMQVICKDLDKIRPSYSATMLLFPDDEPFSVTIPFQVFPGAPRRVLLDSASFMKELVPGEIIGDMVLEVFDEFDNHVKENELISLLLDGLCIQDERSLTFKANQDGFVDLSGILKVVKGFGQRGSLSVISDGQTIFEKGFQTEGRELRAVFEMPVTVTAGSQIGNLAFEIIKMNGEVDEGINNQGENSGSHTLTISSDSFELDSSLKYSFIYGRCTIQEIPLPLKEGKFNFKATHSHHPELNLNVELHILKPTAQILDELVVDIKQTGLRIRRHEANIESLIRVQSILEEGIATLQECLYLSDSNASTLVSEQELVRKQIVSGTDSAAAVICRLSLQSSFEEIQWDFMKNILGLVACLGYVRTDGLSRILAHYLGEHKMLGVVCKSFEESSLSEKRDPKGSISDVSGLDALAAHLGMPLPKNYHVYCVENIRPYTGSVSTDFRRELLLPNPLVPNGKCPPGFLGYAVNMIELDAILTVFRTASGHGLRETLLYNLFGELQVYANRDYMWRASSCVTDGAVSLDGGILRGNGALSFGHRDVKIRFPVCPMLLLPPGKSVFFMQKEAKMDMLMKVNEMLVAERAAREEAAKTLRKQESRSKSLSTSCGSLPELTKRDGKICRYIWLSHRLG